MSKLKRYRCTVSDRRGFKGQCMEEYKDGDYVLWSEAKDKMSRLRKTHERMKNGQKKLMTSLNAGKTISLTDSTIRSLQEQGFDLIVTEQVYLGNLPVYDRIEFFSVKLNK